MTFSSAWIEPGDDEDLAAFLEQSPRSGILPPPPSPYWINYLRDWAQREDLAIEYPQHGEIRVPVTKSQLLRFMHETLGAPAPATDPSSLRDYIEHRCRDDRTYAICADEF